MVQRSAYLLLLAYRRLDPNPVAGVEPIELPPLAATKPLYPGHVFVT